MGVAFAKQIESAEADIKNGGVLGFGKSGAAAEFLRCFVKAGVSWAHIDIAGVSWIGQNVTGYGVRLLYTLLKSSVETKFFCQTLNEPAFC